MSGNKRTLAFTLFIVGLLLIIPTSVHSRLNLNGAGGAYTTGDSGESDSVCLQGVNNVIETYIIQGAGYYLRAYADILAFLIQVEESDTKGWNHSKAQQVLDAALGNMTDAVKTYSQLIRRAEMTPYNVAFISKLMDFDYPGFMTKWRLNPVIFEEVEAYLGKGDVNGMFKYTYNECLTMKRMLQQVKDELSLMKMPDLSKLWKLNEYCSHSMVFAQYSSRVFYAILFGT